MIEIRNLDLLQAVQAVAQLGELPLPAATALKIVRITRAVETAAREIREVQRQTVDRYTQRDGAGVPVPVLDESGTPHEHQVRLTDPAAFQREITALLEASTTLGARALTVDELGADTRIAARTLRDLGSLLEIDGEV